VEALNNRGISRYQLKDYDGAIADLSEAIRLNPKDPHAYNNRAAALRMKGDLASFRQALADYETYLQLGGALQEQIKSTITYMKLMLWLRSRVGR
jgi:Flp pilus assembly protein TadD